MSSTYNQSVPERVNSILEKHTATDLKPEKSLRFELGFTSMDFALLKINLEDEFEVLLDIHTFYPRLILSDTAGDYTRNAEQQFEITSAGLKKLEQHFPHLDLAAAEKPLRRSRVDDLVTVSSVYRLIEQAIADRTQRNITQATRNRVMKWSRRDAIKETEEIILDRLGIDQSEYLSDASLTSLGAESLDVHDIAFLLEKKFDIEIDIDDLLPRAIIQNHDFCQGGKLTDQGIKQLQETHPHTDVQRLSDSRYAADAVDCLSGNSIVMFIQSRIDIE